MVEGTRLPLADRALVEREKIVEYLMNPAHPDNGGKARFFAALGFRRDDWECLAAALARVALNFAVAERQDSVHGEKYVIDGWLDGPEGRNMPVRTIWIVERGTDRPRLVTAYPHDWVPPC